METFFSKLNKFGLLAVLFAALVATTLSAFKSKAPAKATTVQQWYSINITDPSDPNNLAKQEVSTSTISTPPLTDSFGCARTINSGNRCAVLLNVPTLGYTLPSSTEMNSLPSGVSYANSDAKQP